MVRRLAAVLGVVAIVMSPPAVRAQSAAAPASGVDAGNPMLAVCSGFLSQGAGSVSGNKTRLCACLVRETGSSLTTAEMEAYSAASLNSQTPPPAVMEKVMAIATRCLKEAQ